MGEADYTKRSLQFTSLVLGPHFPNQRNDGDEPSHYIKLLLSNHTTNKTHPITQTYHTLSCQSNDLLRKPPQMPFPPLPQICLIHTFFSSPYQPSVPVQTYVFYTCIVVHQLSSTQLCSTISRTRRLYSRRFSLYNRDASLLAGLAGFGSHNRLCMDVSMALISYIGLH